MQKCVKAATKRPKRSFKIGIREDRRGRQFISHSGAFLEGLVLFFFSSFGFVSFSSLSPVCTTPAQRASLDNKSTKQYETRL